MSKHTPGPWSIDGDILLTHVDPFGDTPFGRVNISHELTEDEREANRALIAAAPDLLEALDKMLDHFEGRIPLELFELSESAIARAKGESS